jgi:hypothetical protein
LICEFFCIYFVAFKKNCFSCGNQIRLVLNPRQHETNKGELYKVFFLLVANTDPAGAVTNATDFKESIFCRTNGKKNPFRSPEARRSNIFFVKSRSGLSVCVCSDRETRIYGLREENA